MVQPFFCSRSSRDRNNGENTLHDCSLRSAGESRRGKDELHRRSWSSQDRRAQEIRPNSNDRTNTDRRRGSKDRGHDRKSLEDRRHSSRSPPGRRDSARDSARSCSASRNTARTHIAQDVELMLRSIRDSAREKDRSASGTRRSNHSDTGGDELGERRHRASSRNVTEHCAAGLTAKRHHSRTGQYFSSRASVERRIERYERDRLPRFRDAAAHLAVESRADLVRGIRRSRRSDVDDEADDRYMHFPRAQSAAQSPPLRRSHLTRSGDGDYEQRYEADSRSETQRSHVAAEERRHSSRSLAADVHMERLTESLSEIRRSYRSDLVDEYPWPEHRRYSGSRDADLSAGRHGESRFRSSSSSYVGHLQSSAVTDRQRRLLECLATDRQRRLLECLAGELDRCAEDFDARNYRRPRDAR